MKCPMSRRSVLSQGAFAAGGILTNQLWAQNSVTVPPLQVNGMDAMRTAAAKAVIVPQPLRGGVTFLRGPFGNILVLAQPNGAVVVDSGLREAQPQIQAAIDKLSPVVPTTLINTHWHTDHTDGNEWMHARGAVITAHRNTQKRLSTPQITAAMKQEIAASATGARPTQVFDTESHKRLGTVKIAMRYYQPAHTDGDISVHFEEPDVIHVGDIWYNGFYPLIDYSSGGRIDGMIDAVRITLTRVSATTMIVPGHGPVGTKEELVGWVEMLSGVRERVDRDKRQGKTLDEVIASKPTAAYDGRFIARAIPTDVFVSCVYKTL